MRVQLPKGINFVGLVSWLSLLSAVGYCVFFFTGEIWLGALTFILLFVFYPVVKRYRFNRKFSKYLSAFGDIFTKEYTQEIFDASVMGCIPFCGDKMHCAVFADETGILVSKRGTQRHIEWRQVVGHKNQEYLGQPILEINFVNYEQSNRLLIPWAEKFAKYIP